MEGLQVFSNDKFGNVRVLRENDSVLFVARDVAAAIGCVWGGSTISHVPSEWRSVRPVRTNMGVQKMSVLLEPGLYFFLSRSDKPDAIKYQKWVAGEVLPSIRKTGVYSVYNSESTTASESEMPDFMDAEALCAAWGKERALRMRAEALLAKREGTCCAVDGGCLSPAREQNAYSDLVKQKLIASDHGYRQHVIIQTEPIEETYMPIKCIPWLYDIFDEGTDFSIKVSGSLKRMSKMYGKPVKKDSFSRNAYHKDIVEQFHNDLLATPTLLAEFRRQK